MIIKQKGDLVLFTKDAYFPMSNKKSTLRLDASPLPWPLIDNPVDAGFSDGKSIYVLRIRDL